MAAWSARNSRGASEVSSVGAAPPEIAIPLYERFVALLREHGARSNIAVETGEFGAMMDVELVNDGPVTLILEK